MLSESQTEKNTYQMNLLKIPTTHKTNDNRKPEQCLLLASRQELKGITRELSEVRESFYILIGYWLYMVMWLPRWLSGKEPICQCKRCQRCKVQPLGGELLPGKSHGWRSLVGCCLWGRKESDTTERLI